MTTSLIKKKNGNKFFVFSDSDHAPRLDNILWETLSVAKDTIHGWCCHVVHHRVSKRSLAVIIVGTSRRPPHARCAAHVSPDGDPRAIDVLKAMRVGRAEVLVA